MIVAKLKGNIITLTKSGLYSGMIQGCNCFTSDGKGLAPQVKAAFPDSFEADQRTISGDLRKLGRFSLGVERAGNKRIFIVNAYTQFEGGPNGDITAILRAFQDLNTLFGGRDQHFLIPLIGCGIAGLEWEDVKNVIDSVTPDLALTLVEYQP